MLRSSAECHLQLLERQVYSVARRCPDQSFLSLCHRRCVAGLSMFYIVNLNFNPCLFSELSSASTTRVRSELRPQLIHWSLKYQGVERPLLLGLSCRLSFECIVIFPTLCLTPERCIGSGYRQPLVASLICVFFNFSWRWRLWGCKNNL